MKTNRVLILARNSLILYCFQGFVSWTNRLKVGIYHIFKVLKVYFIRQLIVKFHYLVLKYWFALALTFQPKVSLFHDPGKGILQIAPLTVNRYSNVS